MDKYILIVKKITPNLFVAISDSIYLEIPGFYCDIKPGIYLSRSDIDKAIRIFNIDIKII